MTCWEKDYSLFKVTFIVIILSINGFKINHIIIHVTITVGGFILFINTVHNFTGIEWLTKLLLALVSNVSSKNMVKGSTNKKRQ